MTLRMHLNKFFKDHHTTKGDLMTRPLLRLPVFILIILFVISGLWQQQVFAQDRPDSIEVFLIDSYITPELPHRFVLTFSTSSVARSKVLIDDKDEFTISDSLADTHKAEIDISGLQFTKTVIPFFIVCVDSLGNVSYSDRYEVELPYEAEVKGGSYFLTFCLFGSIIFGLPSPVYVRMQDRDYFSLTKEIPLVFLKTMGLGYPLGYFSVEYSHIFNAPKKNFLRAGYKHIIDIPGIEYISPGINGFTNFKGFNGISPEISVGWFRMFNVFTLYTRYRYNAKPGEAGSEFQEISLGLYSGFFAIYL